MDYSKMNKAQLLKELASLTRQYNAVKANYNKLSGEHEALIQATDDQQDAIQAIFKSE